MVSLERVLGLSLFIHRRDGYELTSAGNELLELADAVEQEVLGIERWRSAAWSSVQPHSAALRLQYEISSHGRIISRCLAH